MKTCTRCHLEKEDSEFPFDKRRNNYTTPCKECRRPIVKAATNRWRLENPQSKSLSKFKTDMKLKYGITTDEVVSIWERQNRCCAICTKPISIRGPKKSMTAHIDHSHVTGVVRGLLCLTCNTGLGMFGDSIDLLEAARDYLLSRDATTLNAADTTTVTVDSNLISKLVN